MIIELIIELNKSEVLTLATEKNVYTVTRKIQLIVDGDKEEINRVYKYIRDGMYAQNRAYNILISAIYTAIISCKSQQEINDIYKKGQRVPKKDKPEWSLYYYDDFEFPKGMQTAASVKMKVMRDLKKSKEDGLFKGKVSLPNRKLDAPLIIERQQFNFYHGYATDEELFDNIYTVADPNIYMKFVNGIHFKLVFGNPHRSHELRSVFYNIFKGIYKPCGSSIQFKGKKIMLNLTLQMPVIKKELDENIVVGVDLGAAIPAMCSLNTNNYVRLSIGDRDAFIGQRMKIQDQRKRLAKGLKNARGGHGRKKKLKPLDRYKEYEKHWVESVNHSFAKQIVDFALKHNAKYINIEDLTGVTTDNKFLHRNWSYFQLQQYITYKAEKYGIIVRKVKAAYTSQTCSCCGYCDSGNRPKDEKGQAYFKCLKCGVELNADFNASQNIARSTEFVDGKSKSEKPKKIDINKRKAS